MEYRPGGLDEISGRCANATLCQCHEVDGSRRDRSYWQALRIALDHDTLDKRADGFRHLGLECLVLQALPEPIDFLGETVAQCGVRQDCCGRQLGPLRPRNEFLVCGFALLQHTGDRRDHTPARKLAARFPISTSSSETPAASKAGDRAPLGMEAGASARSRRKNGRAEPRSLPSVGSDGENYALERRKFESTFTTGRSSTNRTISRRAWTASPATGRGDLGRHKSWFGKPVSRDPLASGMTVRTPSDCTALRPSHAAVMLDGTRARPSAPGLPP